MQARLAALLFLLPQTEAVVGTPCLQLWEVSVNGCYDGSIDDVADQLNELLQDCEHDAETELALIGADFTSVCAAAWDQVDTTKFSDIYAEFSDSFMSEYVAGDTFLNTETGSFENTPEGTSIDSFRDAEATTSVLSGFDPLDNCEHQSIMCCFGRDRQPDDDNGNCATPLDQNCIDADPADNSNLCYTEHNLQYYSDPFAFPLKSEGPIHCHGLAWSSDNNDFISQLKFNNFFYVSLYDHMYTRGYVETTVDTDSDLVPMCACTEKMPKVSRADCTEIDATLTFIITFSSGILEATPQDDLNVEFNACDGINPGNGNAQANDLGSYIYRLNEEGKLSDSTKDLLYKTLVGYAQPGNNENEEACINAYEQEFGTSYPTEVANTKCPLNDPSRLFRTEDTNPLTLEQCHGLCYDTEGCQYFSIGLSPGNDNHKGVCIGCTSEASQETHRGFNSYVMTDVQVFPTPAPTPDPEEYDTVGANIKCPHENGQRLFRTADNAPLTVKECYEECYATPGCSYFTLGEDPANNDYVGVCMGCIEGSTFATHAGFKTYEMVVTQDFGTEDYDLIGLSKKCPTSNRLFRTPDNAPLTLDECYEKCAATAGCSIFTLGETPNRENWVGVCMGCAGGTSLGSHTGFNSYEIAP